MWRRLVAAIALAVLLTGLVTTEAAPAEAATYYNSRCGNTSGRVLLTFDDWAYGDPYRATRIGAYLQSRNIRAAFFLINQNAKNYPGIVSTLRQQGHWVLNHTYSHPDLPTAHGLQPELADPQRHLQRSVAAPVRRVQLAGIRHRGQPGLSHLYLDDRYPRLAVRQRQPPKYLKHPLHRPKLAGVRQGERCGPWAPLYELPERHFRHHRRLAPAGTAFCRNRGPVGRTMPFPASCT
jgi:peptidoglycan/xylan/chitin deacetylase (PgdA/CDA1 family)